MRNSLFNKVVTTNNVFILVLFVLHFHRCAAIGVNANLQTAVVEDVLPTPTKVVDLQNRPLSYGKTYAIMVGYKAGVGYEEKKETCPLYVVQQPDQYYPLFFLRPRYRVDNITNLDEDRDNSIYEGRSMNIRFSSIAGVSCELLWSPIWQVINDEINGMKTGLVKLVGDFAGGEVLVRKPHDLFQIINTGMKNELNMNTPRYKLQFCPQFPRDKLQPCKDIGVRPDPDTGKPFLVVNDNDDDNPFLVHFQDTKFLPEENQQQ